MKRYSLNGAWQMRRADETAWLPAVVPGSVYADLLDAGKMSDPYWRDNEYDAFARTEKDYVYARTFFVSEEDLLCDAAILRFDGLDTAAEVILNGEKVLSAENMHRTWEISVRGKLHPGENRVEVLLHSPNRIIRERFTENPVYGTKDATRGFPLLRKGHWMFGWDWGARLPDAGIWRDVSLLFARKGRLRTVRIHQSHENGAVRLRFFPETEIWGENLSVRYRVIAPDGSVFVSDTDCLTLENPELWWPNGFGAQPLYTVQAELTDGETVLDTWMRRIGLRTLTVNRTADERGESFAPCVNGVEIFAMGADYVPEDNILRRITPERTRRLLEDARLANFNTIRVWGGGYYPDDFFFDLCDELGLLVWQDCMFACALYDLTPEMAENIRAEIADNVRRIRHHACLLLWCANNEMEDGVLHNWYKSTEKQREDYPRLFERLIPQVLAECDPDTFFWPSSPSSGGGFDDPNGESRGDMHNWQVWHQNRPFPEYRKSFPRFMSEFGFQSFPCGKTVESFTLPEDRNIFSYVMEKHQRNSAANGKIMHYMQQTFLYPTDFSTLLYASQLLQAEAVRTGAEHWRRHRGVCMGAVYWQLNDCWPVASWSSMDYFGRWKALHYAAKRFFAPVLLSCEENGTLTQRPDVNAEMPENAVEKSFRLNVSNETRREFRGTVRWSVRRPDGSVLHSGEERVFVPPLTSKWLEKQVFPDAPLYESYVFYALFADGREISSGSVLFCAPKDFRFIDPHLTVTRSGDELNISADAYAKSVEIVCTDGDVLFEDNFFDLNPGSRSVRILRGRGKSFTARSVFDIR